MSAETILPACPKPAGPRPSPDDPVFAMHRGGKISMRPTVGVTDRAGLAMAYTPGVARVCTAIAERPELAADYTWVSNTVAVVTDGTAVLGLGDIGPSAAMPVMEGKSLLFQRFAGVDAVPICLACGPRLRGAQPVRRSRGPRRRRRRGRPGPRRRGGPPLNSFFGRTGGGITPAARLGPLPRHASVGWWACSL
jgi:hypothetical protein